MDYSRPRIDKETRMHIRRSAERPQGFLLFCFALGLSLAIPASARHILTADQWRKDLKELAEKLSQEHRAPFHTVSQSDFDKAVADLDRRIPDLADHQVIVEMARLVAMIGDGHTRLAIPLSPGVEAVKTHRPTPAPAEMALLFRRLPVGLYLFRDGLFVQRAAPEFKHLLGAKVLRVGSSTAEQALEAVRGIVSRDNEMGFKNAAPFMLGFAEVLHAVGLAESPDKAGFVLLDGSGREMSVELPALPAGVEPAWVYLHEVEASPLPLWLKNPKQAFWFEYLKDSGTLYVQINEIGSTEKETLAQFVSRIQDFSSSQAVDRCVIDLRQNGGGNNYLNRSLTLGLIRAEKLNRRGRLFTIIGRETFSAAMNLVSQLELLTNTLFVGEPTGASPSHYGDARRFVLPQSGLTVRISSIYWRDWSADEKRKWVAPDIPAEPTMSDYLSHRDPVLEAILSYDPDKSLFESLRDIYALKGLSGAYTHYYKFKTDPANVQVRTEDDLNRLGADLLDQKKYADAEQVFGQNLEDYPDSFEAHLGLGETYLATRDKTKAAASFEQALKIKPGDARAAELLKKARE
jgi:tetratricopeptide (TPR) repeat protein